MQQEALKDATTALKDTTKCNKILQKMQQQLQQDAALKVVNCF